MFALHPTGYLVKYTILLSLFLFFGPVSRSEIIVVTNNADSGAGTLREALQKAAANGNSTWDSIHFALGTTQDDRTIDLKSQLPALSGKLVVDGSTQQGSPWGISEARVRLRVNEYHSQGFYMLVAEKVDSIQLYGLFLHNTKWTIFTTNKAIGGCYFNICNGIIIGAPGKGNYFNGTRNALHAGSYDQSTSNSIPSYGLKVQSNVFGYNQLGQPFDHENYVFVDGMDNAIATYGISNILIGGNHVSERNHIHGNIEVRGEQKSLTIKNNYFAVPPSANLHLDSLGYYRSISIYGGSTHDSVYGVIITDNLIHGKLYFSDLQTRFVVKRNSIFKGRGQSVNEILFPISTYICKKGGEIGGDNPDDANQIFGLQERIANIVFQWDAGQGIATGSSPGVSILKNMHKCNVYQGSGISYNDFSYRTTDSPFVYVTSNVNGKVKGKATPNCRIDLYLDDQCTGCEGEVYLGKTTSLPDSTWEFNTALSGVVIATATSPKGTTSNFSQPEINFEKLKVQYAAGCGKPTGSIKGLRLFGTFDNFEWYKIRVEQNPYKLVKETVAKTMDIENLLPGDYYFSASYQTTCQAKIIQITVPAYKPMFYQRVGAITQPGCGNVNGNISGFIYEIYPGTIQPFKVYGINENGTQLQAKKIGFGWGLDSLLPGKYRLVVEDTITGCADTSDWHSLANQAGPELDLAGVKKANATCNQPNGSITGLTFTNTSGTVWHAWYNEKGIMAGSGTDLVNLPAGLYRFRLKDEAACDTLTSPWFGIENQGSVKIDTSRLTRKASQCIKPTGYLKGITAMGADSYQWIDSAGKIFSTSLDPGNLFPGQYQLVATSASGCTDTAKLLRVEVEQPFDYNPRLTVDFQAPYCDSANGYVRLLNHPTLPGYRYEWVKTTGPNQVLATGFSITNMSPGVYFFFAISPTGCRQSAFAAQMDAIPKPLLSTANLKLTPAGCNGDGSITGIALQAGSYVPVAYRWVDSAGITISTERDLSAGPGRYQVYATDNLGCTVASAPYTISRILLNVPAPQYAPAAVKRNTVAAMQVKNLQQGGQYQLYRQPGDPIPAEQNTSGLFTIGPLPSDTVVFVRYMQDGCQSALTRVEIKVFDKVSFEIPNAFSPNDDGINDIFFVKYTGNLEVHSFQIFDRFGKQVYLTTNLAAGWKGLYNGRPLPAGVYYWVLQAKESGNATFTKNGSITLIR